MKKILYIILLSLLITGCQTKDSITLNEKVNEINNNMEFNEEKTEELKELNKLVDELREDIIELQNNISILQTKNDEVNTELEEYKTISGKYNKMYEELEYYFYCDEYFVTHNGYRIIDDNININGLFIGMTADETETILGNNYEDTLGYSNYNESFYRNRGYEDGTSLSFSPSTLTYACFKDEKYITDEGIKVGMSALKAVEICEEKYEKVERVHGVIDENNKICIGQYYLSDRQLIFRLEFDEYIETYEMLTEDRIVKSITVTQFNGWD